MHKSCKIQYNYAQKFVEKGDNAMEVKNVTNWGKQYRIETTDGKCLWVTKKQLENAPEHPFFVEKKTKIKDLMFKIGIDSLRGIPFYFLTKSVPSFKNRSGCERQACCLLGNAVGYGMGNNGFHDKDLAMDILNAFFEKHPEAKKHEYFALRGDFGDVLVKNGDMYPLYENHLGMEDLEWIDMDKP